MTAFDVKLRVTGLGFTSRLLHMSHGTSLDSWALDCCLSRSNLRNFFQDAHAMWHMWLQKQCQKLSPHVYVRTLVGHENPKGLGCTKRAMAAHLDRAGWRTMSMCSVLHTAHRTSEFDTGSLQHHVRLQWTWLILRHGKHIG